MSALSKLTIETVFPEAEHAGLWSGFDQSVLNPLCEALASDATIRGEVALALANDAFVRDLNHRFRGIDKPTNVLSFPSGETVIEDQEPPFLGDVVLAWGVVNAECQNSGVSLDDHVTHLIVHGILHLVGHDHMQEAEASAMEQIETRVLARLGISDPYGAADHVD